MIRGMKPLSPSPWTEGGRRMTDERTPRSAHARVASSEGMRGTAAGGASRSVPNRPGATIASIRLPDVVTNGRPDPASTAPIASITWQSRSALAWNVEKSCLNAVWMTPSHAAAPSRRLSRSSRSPRWTRAPASPRALAPASERASPRTSWPASMSSLTTAEPTQPVAPVTNTRITLLLQAQSIAMDEPRS